MPAAEFKHIPILLIDVADFTSKYREVERQRALLRHLQQISTAGARFFMPYGDVWAKWRRHGTGDGYYFLFDAVPPQVALEYALRLGEELAAWNDEHPDLPIRLRMALAVGDVEEVGDQYLSNAFAVAERLISYPPFKALCRDRAEPAALVATDLFHHELVEDLKRECLFERLKDLPWNAVQAVDKHGGRHPGYVLGEGWEEPETEPDPAPPPAAVERLLPAEKRYLRLLRRECNFLALAEDRREVSAEPAAGPELAHVYVDLETESHPGAEKVFERLGVPEAERAGVLERLAMVAEGKPRKPLAAGKLPPEELLRLTGDELGDDHPLRPWADDKAALAAARRPLTALEALAGEPYLVLLGDPGSGKSTFVNHLAVTLACRLLGEAAEPLATPSGALEEPWFPVRIVLRRWSAGLSPEAVEEGREHELVYEALADLPGETVRERWIERFDDRRTLVLFDGLDEVPTVAADDKAGEGEVFDRRRVIVAAVEAFRAAHPECRVLVTCRVKPYRDGPCRLAACPTVELAPLDDGRVDRFCHRWYGELARVGRLTTGEAVERRDRLLAALGERPVLREMAGTPLLLTMLARVNTRSKLPESRAELYGECVEQLLWEWERQKRGVTVTLAGLLERAAARPGAALKRADFERVLWRLTFEAHGRSGKEGIVDLPVDDLRRGLAEIHSDRDGGWAWANAVIELMRERGGLLVDPGTGVFTFPHRSFQEYLACRWLLEQGEAPLTAGELAGGDAWGEVILLACGYLAAEGRFGDLQAIVAELVAGEAPEEPAGWRRVLLAGRAWLEFGPHRAQGRLGEELGEKIPRLLTALMQQGDLPPEQRLEAGLIASDLGDLPADLDVWVEIPADQLEYPFQIGKYPVTNSQYRRFVAAGGYDREKGWFSEEAQNEILRWEGGNWPAGPRYGKDPRLQHASQPVTRISWYEAAAYGAWLTAELRVAGEIDDRQEVRLPTVAEWQRTAGGVEGRKYSWEGEFDSRKANTNESGLNQPAPVHMYPAGATPEGIFDLTGNVWEWTADTARGRTYLVAGGSRWQGADSVGAAARARGDWFARPDALGFRVVVVPISRAAC